MASVKPDLASLLTALPPIVQRKNIEKHLDGFISRGYMANLDNQGRGPKLWGYALGAMLDAMEECRSFQQAANRLF